MKVRVLGCSGAIAKDCRTTSFLIDSNVLIDAGTGVGDLTRSEMLSVDHVFLTHSHLDHIAALPLMIDTIVSARTEPLQIYALTETIAALKAHIFNDVIWPDFTRIPSANAPIIRFNEILVSQTLKVGTKTIEVMTASHTVPAVGYAISAGQACWIFTGDTGPNPALWQRIRDMNVAALVIETAFSDREAELAKLSLHLSPSVLASELEFIDTKKRFPIYITHTKPAETEQIMAEIKRYDQDSASRSKVAHDIRWLCAGQEFDI